MRSFLYILKVALKLFPSKNIDPCIDIYYISKLTYTKFKKKTFLVLEVITLFLLGVYFLLADIFLHNSSSLSISRNHIRSKKINTVSMYENDRHDFVISLKHDSGIQICDLSSISKLEDSKTSNSNPLDMHVEKRFLYSNSLSNHKQSKFLSYFQATKNREAYEVWINQIQATFYVQYIAILSNRFKMNYKIILS